MVIKKLLAILGLIALPLSAQTPLHLEDMTVRGTLLSTDIWIMDDVPPTDTFKATIDDLATFIHTDATDLTSAGVINDDAVITVKILDENVTEPKLNMFNAAALNLWFGYTSNGMEWQGIEDQTNRVLASLASTDIFLLEDQAKTDLFYTSLNDMAGFILGSAVDMDESGIVAVNAITEPKLNMFNAPTLNYAVTWTTNGMEWTSFAGTESDPTITDNQTVTLCAGTGADCIITFDTSLGTPTTLTIDYLTGVAEFLYGVASAPSANPSVELTDTDFSNTDVSFGIYPYQIDTANAGVLFRVEDTGAIATFLDYNPTLSASAKLVLPDDSIGIAEVDDADKSGNGTDLVTSNGAGTSGNCMQWGAAGNATDAGAACGAGGSGDVLGPTTSTDNSVARFNGTDNKTIQGSAVLIDDNGVITTGGTGSLVAGNGTTDLHIDPAGQSVLLGDGAGNEIEVTDAGVMASSGTGSIQADLLSADSVDDMGEIAAAIKRGPDATDTHLLTTDSAAPASIECLAMDTDGSVVTTGGPCGVAGGEANTSSSDGGGLSVVKAKDVVDLPFASFASADFDLAIDLFTIDDTKWATDGQVATEISTHTAIGDAHYVHATTLAELNTDLTSNIADGAHFSPTAGLSTNHGIANLANLNTDLGSNIADGVHFTPTAGLNTNHGINTLADLNTDLGSSIADGIHFVPTAGLPTDHGAGSVAATTDLAAGLCAADRILERQASAWACIPTPTGGGSMSSFDITDTDATPILTVNEGEQIQFIGAGEVTVVASDDAGNHDMTITGTAHFAPTAGLNTNHGINTLSDLNTDLGSSIADGIHFSPTAGLNTNHGINTLSDLNTDLGSSIADGAHTADQVGTVVSGEFCQGGVGDVLDCDIPTIPVGNGGTGNSSLTSGGLLIGNSSNAITVTAQPTDGQLLMGSTGIDPVLATISPTANETEVTNGTGSITVGLVAAPTVSAANMDSYPENFSKTLYRSTGLTDADDIGPVWRAPANAEITAVWCESDTGALSITLEDDLGNDLTTGCACSGGAACTLTGNVAYTAGERLEFIMVSAGTNNSVFFDVRYDLD